MTYDQLVTLDAIVKHGSFKAASEFLHKSQPSLSMAIKKLEEEFDIKLFNREAYRPALTDEGMAFYQKSLITLDKFNELEIFAKELSLGVEAEINISIDAICPLQEVSKTFKSFLDPHITTNLNLSVDMLSELKRKLVENEIDFALGVIMEIDDEIEAIPILKTSMIPVICSNFYEETDGSIEELQRFPQIIVQSTSKTSKSKIFGAVRGMRQWFTTDMSMKEQLILSGLGWGRLPSHQVDGHIKENRLSIVKDIIEIQSHHVDIYLLRNKNKIMGPNTKRLWKHLANLNDKF